MVEYNKIYVGEKVRHTFFHNLRTVIWIFQPQIGRKIRILQPGRENSILIKKSALRFNVIILLLLLLLLLLLFQEKVAEEEPMAWPGTLAVVHSYLAHKTGTEIFFVMGPKSCYHSR